jgi:hypothetical protein
LRKVAILAALRDFSSARPNSPVPSQYTRGGCHDEVGPNKRDVIAQGADRLYPGVERYAEREGQILVQRKARAGLSSLSLLRGGCFYPINVLLSCDILLLSVTRLRSLIDRTLEPLLVAGCSFIDDPARAQSKVCVRTLIPLW